MAGRLRNCVQCRVLFYVPTHKQRLCSDECRIERKLALDREAARKRRAMHPEITKALQADWTDRNREHVNAKAREWRARNPQYVETARAWRERNKERLKEYDHKRWIERKARERDADSNA